MTFGVRAVLVAACLLVLPACGDDGGDQGLGITIGPDGGTVASPDGRLMLEFPAGALSESVLVSVASPSRDAWPDDIIAVEPLAAYRLKPDDVEFGAPVRFMLMVDVAPTDWGLALPVVVSRAGDVDDYEPVPTDLEADLASGAVTITGAVEHFSWIVVHDGGLTIALEEIGSPQVVGVAWEAEAKVRNDSDPNPISGYTESLVVTRIHFGAYGDVDVVGTEDHAGFTLTHGTERVLDLPKPRWSCTGAGLGHYYLSVGARVGGDLFDNASYAARWLTMGLFGDATYSAVVSIEMWCVLPVVEETTTTTTGTQPPITTTPPGTTTTTTLAAVTTTTIDEATTTTVPEPPKPPEFWFNWEGPAAPQLEWEQVAAMTDSEIRALGDGIAIPGFCDDPFKGEGAHFFPFPRRQFTIEPPDEPANAYCPNDHYVGGSGLDVYGNWIPQPDGVCAWSSPVVGDGVILLSGEQLGEWIMQYRG